MIRNKTITILAILTVVTALAAFSAVGRFAAAPVFAAEQTGEFEGPDHPGHTDCVQAGPGNVDHDKNC